MTNLELLVSTDIYLEDQRAILTTNLSSDEEILSDIHRRKRAERAKSDLYTEESDGFSWFVKNMEKGNVTKRLEAIAASGSTTTTVTTPKGTKVSAIIYEDMSATEKKEKNDLYASLYPAATRIYTATKKFNCHSYAWHSQNYSTNKYWIRDPEAYRTDGSYSVTTKALNRKVWYENGTHSAIVSYYSNGTTLFTSKWGVYGLYSHAPTYGPQFGYKQGVTYYK